MFNFMKKGGVEKEEKEKRKKEKKERKENKKRDRGSMTAEELLRLDEVSTEFDDTNKQFHLHFCFKEVTTFTGMTAELIDESCEGNFGHCPSSQSKIPQHFGGWAHHCLQVKQGKRRSCCGGPV
jgi:hypothetical protein